MAGAKASREPARRAVLIDALGTLIGIEPPWQRLVDLLASRHEVTVSVERAVAALRAEMAYYRGHCQAAGDAGSLARLRAACAEVVAGELGGDVALLDRAALTRTLLDCLRFAAYPDAAPALGALRRARVSVVVVSNWDISLHEALASCGLDALVDGVICSAEVGFAKPAPEIFAAALARAGAGAERAVHVGDSYAEDVRGARAAGIDPVLLARPPGDGGLIGAEPPAAAGEVRTISSLAELCAGQPGPLRGPPLTP
jgi:putative hydrolase of the HAD superfamily